MQKKFAKVEAIRVEFSQRNQKMTQPDFMVAKPTEARAKYSLIGTTLDPTLKDEDWIKTEYERDVKKPKATLHDCYHDPFLRMTAYR